MQNADKIIDMKSINRFSDGQRIMVRFGNREHKLLAGMPYSYDSCDGKIGYIRESFEVSQGNGDKCCYYEILVPKDGVMLRVPETCLESAERGQSVL